MRLPVSVAVTLFSVVALAIYRQAGPSITLMICTGLSITNLFLALSQTMEGSMRADIRAELRELRERAESHTSTDSQAPPVVFSGTVHTVILKQEITAESVHIGAPPEEEPTG